ncbi:hypothetical protein PGTUg99_006487 [Puccinia graminis f. sp. tritici]|uniref:Uncharacterized protein n=1 Tax=Puccinia graminis f. sp. tritici TaxID=56615 RepID=A0A5B0P451_PUCGR|nr:hypothetical protein PGTUg99_006487 [Puccinia graminis f. sp. tritici]
MANVATINKYQGELDTEMAAEPSAEHKPSRNSTATTQHSKSTFLSASNYPFSTLKILKTP